LVVLLVWEVPDEASYLKLKQQLNLSRFRDHGPVRPRGGAARCQRPFGREEEHRQEPQQGSYDGSLPAAMNWRQSLHLEKRPGG